MELEPVNAMQIYRQLVNTEDKFEIKNALENLKKLINEKITARYGEKRPIELGESEEDNQQKM